MNRAFVFLGTNIDRRRNYLSAVQRLAQLGDVRAVSSVYETAPIGNTSAGAYYNGAVLLETEWSARELRDALRAIEAQMGRVRTSDPNASRTIDLDLVLHNREIIGNRDLEIPDPLILERPFVAIALAELDPQYVHPLTGETLAGIARRFGPNPRGMRLDAEMTAELKKQFKQMYAGETYA